MSNPAVQESRGYQLLRHSGRTSHCVCQNKSVENERGRKREYKKRAGLYYFCSVLG